jgi:hypothetical protein
MLPSRVARFSSMAYASGKIDSVPVGDSHDFIDATVRRSTDRDGLDP